MKRVAIAAVVSVSMMMPAFAFNAGQPPRGPGGNFEARKGEILAKIDERLTGLQQMKGCIQAARTHDDARACREKFGPKEGRAPDFEQRKAEVLKRIDERLATAQQMKACIQAAKNREEAKVCREKLGIKNGRENRQRRD